jgi:hypothetical protein
MSQKPLAFVVHSLGDIILKDVMDWWFVNNDSANVPL